jgi:hypothetical protein
MKKIIILALVAMSLTLAGCRAPQWLTSNKFLGEDKTMKEFYAFRIQAGQVMTGDTKTEYFDYTVRVCNVDDAGNLSQCMDTVILENVMQNTLYKNFAE